MPKNHITTTHNINKLYSDFNEVPRLICLQSFAQGYFDHFFFGIHGKILALLGHILAILCDKNIKNPYLEVELESRLSRSPSSSSSVQENDSNPSSTECAE